jgi:hypothetical protein
MSEEVTTPTEGTTAVAAVKEMHTEAEKEKEKAVIPIAFSSLITGFQAPSGLGCTPGFQAQAAVKSITAAATSALTAGFGGFDAMATMAKPVAGAPAAGTREIFGASAVSASVKLRGLGAPHAADSADAASPSSGKLNDGGGGPEFGQQQAPVFGASPFGASLGGFGLDATKPATGFGTAAGFGAYIFGSPTCAEGGGFGFPLPAAANTISMRKFLMEENYAILRALIQIKRTKHNDPNGRRTILALVSLVMTSSRFC